MKKSDLKKLIKDELKNINFDFILNNFKELYNKYPNEYQAIGMQLLHEYRIDLGNIYESTPVENAVFYGYEFFDDNGKRHLTVLQKAGSILKMGPARSNEPTILFIDTKKQTSGNDPKLLNTHISNIFKILKDKNTKVIHFEPAQDAHTEARKRLFTNLIRGLQDDIEDVKTDESGVTTLIFK